jgi:citrate synthase
MAVLEEGLTRAHDNQQSLEATAAQTVQEYREAKKRIPGLGHRIHTHDPRTAQLFTLAEELGVAGEGVALLQNMRASLAAAGIDLPINVDGAIAALLIDLQVPRQLANAFFIIARVPGLVAHVHEEQTRERPMRVIHPTDHAYDGPESRNLAKE